MYGAKPFKNVILVIKASKVLALFSADHVGQSETFHLHPTNLFEERPILTLLGLPAKARRPSAVPARADDVPDRLTCRFGNRLQL